MLKYSGMNNCNVCDWRQGFRKEEKKWQNINNSLIPVVGIELFTILSFQFQIQTSVCHASNYFYSIYIVFDIISNIKMI